MNIFYCCLMLYKIIFFITLYILNKLNMIFYLLIIYVIKIQIEYY